MIGVFGGAVFPVLQGLLADYVGSWQFTLAHSTFLRVCDTVVWTCGL